MMAGCLLYSTVCLRTRSIRTCDIHSVRPMDHHPFHLIWITADCACPAVSLTSSVLPVIPRKQHAHIWMNWVSGTNWATGQETFISFPFPSQMATGYRCKTCNSLGDHKGTQDGFKLKASTMLQEGSQCSQERRLLSNFSFVKIIFKIQMVVWTIFCIRDLNLTF